VNIKHMNIQHIGIPERVNANGSVSFFFRWTDPVTGKPCKKMVQRTEPQPTPRALREYRALLHRQAMLFRSQLEGADREGGRQEIMPIALHDGLEKYLEWSRSASPHGIPNTAAGTTANRARILGEFLAFINERFPTVAHLHALIRMHVAVWRNENLVARGLAPATINTAIASVGAWCSWAIDHGYSNSNPCFKLKRFPVRTARRQKLPIRTAKDLRELLFEKIRPGQPRFVAALLATTGMRQGEAKALTWQDWDQDARTLQVQGARYERTKQHRRVIPLCHMTELYLMEQWVSRPEDAGPLILSFDGGHHPLTSQINYWCKRGKVKPHDLRRFFISAMEYLGCPQEMIGDLVGHATGKVRAAYTEAVNPGARRWMETFGEWLDSPGS